MRTHFFLKLDMPGNSNLYNASFTAGALLLDETDALIRFLRSNDISEIKSFTKKGDFLKINSQKSRDRKVKEITKRYQSVPTDFWDFYQELSSKKEKLAFLYFVCLKTYSIIRDFHWEVALNKWRQLEVALSKMDFTRFLNWASNKHHEIDEWSETTKAKLAQVILLMMKEAGIIVDGKMEQIFLPDEFWSFFIRQGEGWFLEALFLSKDQRDALHKKVGV